MRDKREVIDTWITARSAHDGLAVRAFHSPDVVVDLLDPVTAAP